MDRREFHAGILGLLGAAIAGPLAAQVQPERGQLKSRSGNPQLRAVGKKVLDRVASDPAFRKQLLANPDRALADAGFEKELQAIQPSANVADCKTTCGYRSCTRTCITTCSISCRIAAF